MDEASPRTSGRNGVKIARPSRAMAATAPVNSSRASTVSIPVAFAASAPGDSAGPIIRCSRRSFFGCRYSVVFFVRPSIVTIARGSTTPVR